MERTELIDAFETYVSKSIDEKGVYPLPMISVEMDDKITFNMLAVDAPEAVRLFAQKICCECAKEVILGLDRTTKEGQGTEFADVLTCYYWKDQGESKPGNNWSKWFNVGVINYQHEPRIVRPLDWGNKFWNEVGIKEIKSFLLPSRIVVKIAKKD